MSTLDAPPLPIAEPPSVATERSRLSQYLARQRWFAAKDQPIAELRVVSRAAIEAWQLVVVEVRFARGEPQLYLLTLEAEGKADAAPRDAAADPEFLRALFVAIRESRRMPAGDAVLSFAATPFLARRRPTGDPEIRPLHAEQSNSSALIGNCGVLKLYRRLRSGIAPEIEMVRFLGERGFSGTPPLLGTLALEKEGATTPLGLLIAFVANRGDAWAFALGEARRHLAADPRAMPDAAFLSLIARLGLRTAELHRALCPMDEADPAFAPEPITEEDIDAWRRAVAEAAEELVETLAAMPRRSRPLDLLIAERERLAQRLARPGAARIAAMKTRHHGDYHLGQVLFTGDDFQIIDFEGEPRRSIAERRAKHSPLRDVAGMVRSFDYAAQAALLEQNETARPALRPRAEGWRRAAVSAFLEGYRAAIAGTPSYPANERQSSALLDLFILEKAIYELRYELASRPEWASIPAAGILALIAAPEGDS